MIIRKYHNPAYDGINNISYYRHVYEPEKPRFKIFHGRCIPLNDEAHRMMIYERNNFKGLQ
jgi:hypothetical protein